MGLGRYEPFAAEEEDLKIYCTENYSRLPHALACNFTDGSGGFSVGEADQQKVGCAVGMIKY